MKRWQALKLAAWLREHGRTHIEVVMDFDECVWSVRFDLDHEVSDWGLAQETMGA